MKTLPLCFLIAGMSLLTNSCKDDPELPDVSLGSSMTLNGGHGGINAVNSVFIDFSNNIQSPVSRTTWDLGFYNGNEFRVILNNTVAASAVATAKTNLSQVTAQDTVGLDLIVAATPESLPLVDDVSGDLTKTVIAAISPIETDNKVYIVNRGTGGGVASRPWKKIRIIRSGSEYILQYADIDATSYKSLVIRKNKEHNFSYASFDYGLISIEPDKDDWDIEWTGAVSKTISGEKEIPHYFADQVYINWLGGVSAAEVLTSTVSYDNISSSNLNTILFLGERNVIGTNWRETGGREGGTAGVKTDRFYVIRDAHGNAYKLKFNNFTDQDGGTRGYPQITYALIN